MNASSAAAPNIMTKSLRIAVADDVPEIQMLASQWLTAAGHVVWCAGDGLELLRLIRDRTVDVVLTDVMMPENDGFEVLQKLKRTRPELKVIAMSGGADVMPRQDCLRVATALGARAVLPKPFNRQQLLDAIERALSDAQPR